MEIALKLSINQTVESASNIFYRTNMQVNGKNALLEGANSVFYLTKEPLNEPETEAEYLGLPRASGLLTSIMFLANCNEKISINKKAITKALFLTWSTNFGVQKMTHRIKKWYLRADAYF